VANSSDWLGALAAEPDRAELAEGTAPGWLALLAGEDAESGHFREASLLRGAEVEMPAPPPPPPDAEPELPAADPHAEALARAHADGVAAGRAAAEAEGAALRERQRALRLTFRALDEAALGVLADDLAATVLHLCEGVLAEAARDPAGLRQRCIAAARRIGGAPDTLALHLHPDDIALLGDEALAVMRLVPDPALEPGSIVIEGADGSVSDGPAEWRRAIAASLRG
jgi:flagellar assembly protein FliH